METEGGRGKIDGGENSYSLVGTAFVSTEAILLAELGAPDTPTGSASHIATSLFVRGLNAEDTVAGARGSTFSCCSEEERGPKNALRIRSFMLRCGASAACW